MSLVDEEMKTRRDDGLVLPPHDYDLVLELEDDSSGGHDWCYYFADHTTKTLVWLQPFEMTRELQAVKGAITLPHLSKFFDNRHYTY